MQLVVVVCLEFSRRHLPEGFEQAPEHDECSG